MSGAEAPDAPARRRACRVLISCGEASGDLYAGALTRELRARAPSVEVRGFGGERLAAAGATLIGDNRGLGVTGLVEPLAELRHYWRLLGVIGAAARAWRPDVFVAVDYPDFNFRLLPVMHRAGVPVVYYISPQLWAWRPGRMRTLRRYAARVLVIFPFEAALYERAGVPVQFVGHPLLDLVAPSPPRDAWLTARGLDPSRPVLALLPGSRGNEVRRILPVLAEACSLIAREVAGVQFVMARAPGLPDDLFAPVSHRTDVVVVSDATDDVLEAADAAVTASGTATVQTAIHGRPMVVVYRLSPVTYVLGRAVVRVPRIAMVNLVAGRDIVPELVQTACTPAAVAREAVSILTDRGRAERMRSDLAEVRQALGTPGASGRAAEAVLEVAAR